MISALPQQYKGPINFGFTESGTSNFQSTQSFGELAKPWFWFGLLSAKRLIFILRKFQTSRQCSPCPSTASIIEMADNFLVGRDRPWPNKNFCERSISYHQQSKEVKYTRYDESLKSAFLHNDQSAIFSMVQENSYSRSSKEINHQVTVQRTSLGLYTMDHTI